jgi:hypothetical protein
VNLGPLLSRRGIALPIAAILLGSCGTPDAQEVLSETAANMSEIRSGKLTMKMITEIKDDPQSTVGFELEGPFSLEAGSLIADMAFTRVAGPERASVRFISTGEESFIDTGTEVREVPPVRFPTGANVPGSGGLGPLPIAHWFENPRLADGGIVGGDDTHRVTANLDVASALADIFAVAGQFGATEVAGLPRLNGADVEHLRRIVRSADIDIYTGKEDLLLRRMEMDVEFGASGPPELRPVLKELARVRFRFELVIEDPNTPVDPPEPPTG